MKEIINFKNVLWSFHKNIDIELILFSHQKHIHFYVGDYIRPT
ncbi:hypothetical protein [Gelidibacter maritimus]|nr:hypothetical protein [Gelidibacter maritimus]